MRRVLACLMLAASGLAAPAAVAAAERPSTVVAPSRFETFTVALPTLGVERTLRVYLPRGYTNCEGCRYPVVYFMDGQNVFDAATSYVGEWGADETLDDLLAKHDLAVIAVGVDHGGDQTAARVRLAQFLAQRLRVVGGHVQHLLQFVRARFGVA